MNKAHREALKKEGKKAVEARSQLLRSALREANPAGIGTEEWINNYKKQVLIERRLRDDPPEFLTQDQSSGWSLIPVRQTNGSTLQRVHTWYYHCTQCNCLLHSETKQKISCACKNLSLDPLMLKAEIQNPTHVQLVKIIPKQICKMGI